MRAEDLRPQAEAVEVLPVVDLAVGVGGWLLDGVAQMDRELPEGGRARAWGGRGEGAGRWGAGWHTRVHRHMSRRGTCTCGHVDMWTRLPDVDECVLVRSGGIDGAQVDVAR